MPAIPSHSSSTRDPSGQQDCAGMVTQAANERATLRHMHAWVDSDGDPDAKVSYKFPHHAAGTDTPANLPCVRNALARLPQADIPEGDRAAVRRHLQRHLDDAQEGTESTMSEDVLQLELDGAVDAGFRVDRPRRTIAGLIMPWGAVARAGFSKWRFKRGSISWSAVSRIKLLRDHDIRNPVGRALDLDDREDGLHGTFAIARGDDGDAVLSLAEDGVLDGFSAGVMFEDPDAWERDPVDEDVRLVMSARLVENTITAMPAFDSARVESVKAHRETRKEMAPKDDNTSTGSGGSGGTDAVVLDHQNAAIEQFMTELDERMKAQAEKTIESVGNTITAAFDAVFTRLQGGDAGDEGKAAAARFKVTREPPVYRFSGSPVDPSMVRDAWRWHRDGDYESRDRLRKFQDQQTDLVKFQQISTTSASDVIPPGYRPDLFVTQLMQGRPIVNLFSRGTITDATPFTVPRFLRMADNAGGADTLPTSDHVEGTNPAPGTLEVDSTVVSPGAISGTFELTREIVDSSNPAIDAIALAAMRESWNQQTEAKAYAAINNAAAVTETLGVGPADAEFIDTARDLLARYPFVRFAAPSGAVISQRVTRAFANAKDTTGRPLLPSVGAQNTAGLGNAVQQGWFIDGLPFVPAWAMTEAEGAGGAGDDVLTILNREDVWAWESPILMFRFEEKRGPALVELALFGYYATHVLRPDGLFAIDVSNV